MLAEREIPYEWVERVLSAPVLEDRTPGATRAYAPIAEFGDRILRVYHDAGSALRVFTLFVDRVRRDGADEN